MALMGILQHIVKLEVAVTGSQRTVLVTAESQMRSEQCTSIVGTGLSQTVNYDRVVDKCQIKHFK